MTNKEAANRLARIFNKYCNTHDEDNRCDHECNLCNRCKDCYDREAYDMVIKALEEAEKYRWHDLRKNPDDLPVKDGTYRCIFKDEENSHFEIDYRKNFGFGEECFLEHCELPECPKEYYFEGLDEDDEVIAWQEIDPFEEEE